MSAITAKASRKMKKYAVLTREPRCFLGSFDFSWEQRKLGEIGSVSMCRRIFKEQTSETGDIPFYKIGTFGADPDAFISRELFEEYKSKYPYPQKGDILISASGSIGRTVEFAGNNEYFQDSNIVWLNHDERLSNPFLKCFYSVVKWAGIEGSTIKRLYNDNILNTVICMPSVPEQKRIGLFFENLDNLITLHQRECISFTARAGRLILTANKKRNTSSWEQRKAIDIADYSKGNGYSKGDLTDAGTPIILYGRLYTKYQFAISEVDTFAVPRNGAVYSQGNEVIVPASGETAEDIARASAVEKSGVLLGGDLNILRPFDFINPLFLALAISNGEPQKELAKKAQGKSVVHIHNTDIQEVTIAYPSRTEQDRIVSVFRQLDHLITLHQRQPFSHSTPDISLSVQLIHPLYTSSWEQRKVSDLAEKTYGGGTPTTSNEAYWNGDIPWIQSSDVVDGKLLGVEPRKWITQDGLNNSAAQLIPGNSIAIITRVGVGKLAFMPYSYATSQDFLSLSKLNAEPLFTVYACYKKLQSELNAVQGTSIKGITKDELLAKNIMVPRYAEQQQIGAFFKQLDNLITLHQRKPFLMKWRTSDANRNQTNRLVLGILCKMDYGV